MNQDNKPQSDTLEAEKADVSTAQQATQQQAIEKPEGQTGLQQNEKPQAEGPKGSENTAGTPGGSQPMAQQPNKGAGQGPQQKR